MGEVWNTRENTRFQRNGRVPRASQRPKTRENTMFIGTCWKYLRKPMFWTERSPSEPTTPRNASSKSRKQPLKGSSRRHWGLEVWRYRLPRLPWEPQHEKTWGAWWKRFEIRITIRIDTNIQKFPQGQLRSRTHQAKTSWFRICIYAMRL